MTQDNDTEHVHASPPRKSYNPFDSDDDTLDSPGLESENVYTKEEHSGFDLKAFDISAANALTLCMDTNGDLSWEEAVFGQNEAKAKPNGNANLLDKDDGQLYTDKNVTDCELPELVVCYKDDSYQSVKDIGIDEGVPTLDKIWVQTSEDEVKDNDMKTDKSKLADIHLVDQTDTNKKASKPSELDLTDKDGPDHGDTVVKKEKDISPGEPETVVIQESAATGESHSEPDKNPNEEKTLHNYVQEVEVQESIISRDSKIVPNGKVEYTSITSLFGPSKNADYRKQESENIESGKPPTAQSMTRQEESRFHGETSFSSNVSVPLPSSITFTGPVSYSGSISIRSESSAGSTRSFAFPVLQTEWNTSPERMVKADPRQYRKQKGWMQALICCRF